LVTNRVDAVVYAPDGPGAAAIGQLFATTFGAPSARGGGLEIWRRDGRSTCRS
jgi:hypothetical protein